MSVYIAKRNRVFTACEDDYGAFNSDDADHQEIRPEADGFEHEGKTEILERSYVRADLGNSPGLPGAPSCRVKLQLPARGGGEEAGHTEEAGMCPELETLTKTCVGSLARNTGSNIDGGGQMTVQVTQSQVELHFSLGGLILIDPIGAGVPEARWIFILNDDNDSIIFAGANAWRGGSAWYINQTPNTDGVVYACVQTNPGPATLASACMEISGIAVDSSQPVWQYTGLVGNLKIDDSAAQKRVMLSYELLGDKYSLAEGTPQISISGGAEPWPDAPGDLRALSADFRINGSQCAYRSFSLDIGNEWGEILNGNAQSGRDGYALTKIATGGRAVVYWDDSFEAKLVDGEYVDISWVVGKPENAIGFHAPTCEIRGVKETQINGLLAMEIQFTVLPSGFSGIPDWTLAFAGRTDS